MSRIFDHKKQYVCTEVFRLEEIQESISTLEELIEPDHERFHQVKQRLFKQNTEIEELLDILKKFIENLEEEEKRK